MKMRDARDYHCVWTTQKPDMHMGQFSPIQSWEVVRASVNLPSPARDASTTTPIQPTDACTATTIFMRPSDSLRWLEMPEMHEICDCSTQTHTSIHSWPILSHMTLEPIHPRGSAFHHKWEEQMLKKEPPEDQIAYGVAHLQKYTCVITHRYTGWYICCSDTSAPPCYTEARTHKHKQDRT